MVVVPESDQPAYRRSMRAYEAKPYLGIAIDILVWTEKSLKALLYWNGVPFRHTHDLDELSKQVRDIEPGLSSELDAVPGLTSFAVEQRYPEYEEATLEEARVGRRPVPTASLNPRRSGSARRSTTSVSNAGGDEAGGSTTPDLGIRHRGEIYEGLLQFEAHVAPRSRATGLVGAAPISTPAHRSRRSAPSGCG